MYTYPVLSPENLLLGCIRFDCLGLFPPQVPGLSKRGALNSKSFKSKSIGKFVK